MNHSASRKTNRIGIRSLYAVFSFLLFGVGAIQAQTNAYWTGAGTDSLWSNANNWQGGVVPNTASHIAHFGTDAPDSAQTVTVDSGFTVQQLQFNTGGSQNSQQFTFESSGGGSINLESNLVGIFSQALANDVIFNMPINVTHTDTNSWFVRNRTSQTLIFNGDFDSGARTLYVDEGKQVYNASLTNVASLYLGSVTPADLTLNTTTFSSSRALRFNTGSDATVRFGSDITFGRGLDIGPVYDGIGYFQLVNGGSNDRTVTFARSMENASETGKLESDENEAGSTGRFILRATGSSSNGVHTVAMETQANTYAQFDASFTPSGSELTYGTTADIAAVISGAGNLWKSNTDELSVKTVNTYAGRTMISGGVLRLDTHTIDTTTYEGQLPSGTVIEIADTATFDLNGIDQTVGGLTGWRGLDEDQVETFGTVVLGGASLTIDASGDTTFGGDITGAGELVKAGAGTFTKSNGYTNPAGRTLRVESGLLAVDGDLDVTDGIFELAGGQISANNLTATGTEWNLSLNAGNENQTLVEISTNADITDAILLLELAGGYTPTVGDSYTVIRADTIVGASQGGALFQYTDGDVFTADGIDFEISWEAGSENVVLTAIPEPNSAALLFSVIGLTGALICRRRYQRS